MREIKFRIGCKQGNGFRYLDKDELFNLYRLNPYDGSLIVKDNGRNVVVPREAYVIEQYTGLKDKNGTKIYEGDVVKVNDDFDKYGLNSGEIYEVYFNAGGFRCKPKYESSIARGDKGFWIDDGNDYEVIGNIHENHELLKEKE